MKTFGAQYKFFWCAKQIFWCALCSTSFCRSLGVFWCADLKHFAIISFRFAKFSWLKFELGTLNVSKLEKHQNPEIVFFRIAMRSTNISEMQNKTLLHFLGWGRGGKVFLCYLPCFWWAFKDLLFSPIFWACFFHLFFGPAFFICFLGLLFSSVFWACFMHLFLGHAFLRSTKLWSHF